MPHETIWRDWVLQRAAWILSATAKSDPRIQATTNRLGPPIAERNLSYFLDNLKRTIRREQGIILLCAFCVLVACHPRPTEDLVLADVAVRAAQKSRADTLSPDAFRQAENHFLRAKKDYQEGYFDSCKKNATQARLLAEKAEYEATMKQMQLKGKMLNDDEPYGAPVFEGPKGP